MSEYSDPMVRWMTVSEGVKRRGGKAVSREVVLCELVRLYYDGIVPIGLRCGRNEQGLCNVTRLELEEPADPSDGIVFDMLAKELIRIDKFDPEKPSPHTIHVNLCCVLLGRPELEAVWPADNTSEGETSARRPSGPKTPWHVGARRWLVLVAAGRARGYSFEDSASQLAKGMAAYLDSPPVKHPGPDQLRKFIAAELIMLQIRTR